MCVLQEEKIFEMVRTKCLTNSEWALLIQLLPLMERDTNVLVSKELKYLNLKKIAKMLKRDLSGISRLINSLIQKKVILEVPNVSQLKEHGRIVTERPLFINPDVAYNGNINNVKQFLAERFNLIRL